MKKIILVSSVLFMILLVLSLNAQTFTLQSDNFSGIDAGDYVSPGFTDIDGDGLLDLLVGEQYGTINHYEQDGVNSLSFPLVTDNWQDIDVGGYAIPHFTDLDGDDLLDLLCGTYTAGTGRVWHYEQDDPDTTGYLVSGAGTAAANGYYYLQGGTVNGDPWYQKADGYVIHALFLGGSIWSIDTDASGDISNYCAWNTTGLPPLTGWDVYPPGAAPAPTLSVGNPGPFTLRTTTFAGVMVYAYSFPTITDLDGDGLLDLIVGGNNGVLAHYEQNEANSTSFTNITHNFNGIDVGSISCPAFTDLDGDGLLDLMVGEQQGTIYHYEQDEVNSLSFTLVTGNWQGIDVVGRPNMAFKDIDGDQYLDLLVGERYGHIYHYESDFLSPVNPPTVTVDVPNGGEVWYVNETYQIQWTSEDNESVTSDSVFYSIDNGSNWIFITSHTGNPQACDWTIPNTSSEQCLIKVVVYDNENYFATDVSDAVFSIEYGINNQVGFPIDLGGSTSEPSPQVADIDGDGDLEVLMGGDSSLHVFHHDGTPVTGFPVSTGGLAKHTAAVADIDDDGVVDIIIAGQVSDLFVYNNDGTLKTGWPQYLGDDDGAACSPAVADLDGDGDLEIVIGTYRDANGNNGFIDARMYVFHHDGTLFDGWPILDVDHFAVNSTPAIGDIDNDGDLEIIICGRDDSMLRVWNADGTDVTGFPLNLGGICEASPTLADIDDDGDLEIFIPSGATVYGYHHDGTAITGWPQYMSGGNERSSASIGDLDGDDDLEIICGGPDGNVYAWHHTGVSVTGWPQATAGNFAQGTPSIGDIDGDGDMEIIENTYSGVYAWHHNGTILPYYPLSTGGTSRSSTTIIDLDQDGDIEVLTGGSDNKLHVWDLTGIYNADNIEWESFRNDLLNRGNYAYDVVLTPPQNVTISINYGIVTIEWNAVPGANLYNIYSSDDPYAADWGAAIDSETGTSWIEGVSGDKKYYRVTAE